MTTRPLLLATLLAAALAAADVTVQHTDADKTVTTQDEQLPAVVSEEPQQPAWENSEISDGLVSALSRMPTHLLMALLGRLPVAEEQPNNSDSGLGESVQPEIPAPQGTDDSDASERGEVEVPEADDEENMVMPDYMPLRHYNSDGDVVIPNSMPQPAEDMQQHADETQDSVTVNQSENAPTDTVSPVAVTGDEAVQSAPSDTPSDGVVVIPNSQPAEDVQQHADETQDSITDNQSENARFDTMSPEAMSGDEAAHSDTSSDDPTRQGQYIETPEMWERMRYASLQRPVSVQNGPDDAAVDGSLEVEPTMRQQPLAPQVPAAPLPQAVIPDSAFSYYRPAAQPYNMESRQFVDYSPPVAPPDQLRYSSQAPYPRPFAPVFPPPRPVDFQPQPRIPGPFDVRPASSGAAFGMFPEQRQRAPWMAPQAEEQYAMKPVRWQSDMAPPPMTNDIPDDYSAGRRWSGRQTNELEDRRQPDDDDDDSDGASVEEEVVPALVVFLHKKGGKSLHDKADRFRRSSTSSQSSSSSSSSSGPVYFGDGGGGSYSKSSAASSSSNYGGQGAGAFGNPNYLSGAAGDYGTGYGGAGYQGPGYNGGSGFHGGAGYNGGAGFGGGAGYGADETLLSRSGVADASGPGFTVGGGGVSGGAMGVHSSASSSIDSDGRVTYSTYAGKH